MNRRGDNREQKKGVNNAFKTNRGWYGNGERSRRAICSGYPFTLKSDHFLISPAASPEILHHTVWRTWLFIVLPTLTTSPIHFSLKGWENVLFLNWEGKRLKLDGALYSATTSRWKSDHMKTTQTLVFSFFLVTRLVSAGPLSSSLIACRLSGMLTSLSPSKKEWWWSRGRMRSLWKRRVYIDNWSLYRWDIRF